MHLFIFVVSKGHFDESINSFFHYTYVICDDYSDNMMYENSLQLTDPFVI